jgi:hypothetical protein
MSCHQKGGTNPSQFEKFKYSLCEDDNDILKNINYKIRCRLNIGNAIIQFRIVYVSTVFQETTLG